MRMAMYYFHSELLLEARQATQGSWNQIPADLETSEYEDKGSLVHALILGGLLLLIISR